MIQTMGVKGLIIQNIISEGPHKLIRAVRTELFFVIVGEGIPEGLAHQQVREKRKDQNRQGDNASSKKPFLERRLLRRTLLTIQKVASAAIKIPARI